MTQTVLPPTPPPIQRPATAELLAAERVLGRLVQQREDAGDMAATLSVCALRREAWATMGLDGDAISMTDLATAQLSPNIMAGGKQRTAERALSAIRAAERMLGGLHETDMPTEAAERPKEDARLDQLDEDADEDLQDLFELDDEDEEEDAPPPSIPASIEATLAAARAARAELEAFMAGGMKGTSEPSRRDAPAGPVLLEPLSPAWMAKAWHLAYGVPGDAIGEALERAAAVVDEAVSSKPGLAGTALALHRLHADSFWPGPPPP
jgi:hypothetical protein